MPNGLDALESEYKGFLHKADELPRRQSKILRTESWGLNHLVGRPGIPIEQVIEIFGPPDSGKTTLANYIIRCGQKQLKKPAVFIDWEGKYELPYAKNCGVRIGGDWLRVARPDVMNERVGEDALQLVMDVVKSRSASVVVLDSIGSIAMRAATESEVSDRLMGQEAFIITRFIKLLTPIKNGSDTVIILLNQQRAKLGVTFGSNTDRSAAWALKHAGMTIRLGRGDAIKRGKEEIGLFINLTAYKTSFGPPWRRAKVPLIYRRGIYPPIELLLKCKEFGLVTGSGHYTLHTNKGEVKLGQGMWNASKALMGYRKQLTPIIRKKLMEKEQEETMEVIR